MNVAGVLSAGFTIKQILNYLGEAFPELGDRIKDAVKAGKSAEDIVKYLSKVDKNQLIKHRGQGRAVRIYPEEPSENPYIAASKSQKEYSPVPKSLETAGKVGLGLAAGYGASKVLPKALQSIGTFISSNIGPKPMSNAPGVSPTSPQEVPAATQPTQGSAPLPQQQQMLQSTPSQISPENSIRIIEQMNIGPQIQTLHHAGNNPEAIAAAIGVSLKPHQRKWLDEQIKEGKAKSLPDLIADYVGGPREKINPVATQPMEEKGEGKKSLRTEFPEGYYEGPNWEGTGAAKRHPSIKAGNVVATPGGDVGTIKSERNGKALVDINGKVKQENADDLISSPISDDELAELHEALIHGIEKKTGEQVSRNVEWAGYNPEANYLAYVPHDGGLYIYPNISKEDADFLTSKLTQRKSTGSNFIGPWEKGTESPIGAAMSALIRRLQGERGGKGKEYLLHFPTVYRALEPAVKAAKEVKKRKKKDERRSD